MASDSQRSQAAAVLTLPQLVSSPLTKVAIFLVVTINPGNDHRSTVLSLCADLSLRFFEVLVFAISMAPCHALWGSVPMPGTASLSCHVLLNFILSRKFSQDRDMLFLHRAT